ncbi:uncharacterized protein GGS25DRAFT_534878 [Hypoxylon fragiforme]|uniref:uncharacterized protein n=1 Tax=Hypoxylon fragiforme TaxID=63214 RepID=UPI0020C6BE57|nr:uncharacterized protein GGS25DRAFT_534878 [Hypoxylon fragiforme]KAI2604474.1 hypothetical protein GGS25DRAFT_534878 [Hypoxylon fragiforme]
MARDQFNNDDGCGWRSWNVVPWATEDCAARRITSTSNRRHVESFDVIPIPSSSFSPTSLAPKDLNREALTDFEALMLGEISNEGSSAEDEEEDEEEEYEDEEELEMDSSEENDEEAGGGLPFPFMDLPFEIRQQVYRWLHLMTPIRLTQFAPWYPNPISRAYHVRAVTLGEGGSGSAASSTTATRPAAAAPRPTPTPTSPLLLSHSRPHCCLPTALLTTSKQIYLESRHLPFLANEFVFVNWFASGLWAARCFLRGLCAWQMQAMRYARLELLSRDLCGRYAEEEWRGLCEGWAGGLRGLRLKVLCSGSGSGGGGGGGRGGSPVLGQGVSWVVAGSPQRGAPTVQIRDERGRAEEWVENGLKKLRRLRWLEVELAVADWDDGMKVDWCRSLEEAVNEGRGRGGEGGEVVRVSCVEREARD